LGANFFTLCKRVTKQHRSNWIRPQVFAPRWVQWWSTRFR